MASWRTPPAPIPEEQIVSRHTADVVVVGVGYAGTAALRSAAESGAKVIAIEKQKEALFNTWGKDVGHINSKFLERRGVPHVDELEYFGDWMRRAAGRANPELIMRFVRNSGSAFDWYIDMVEDTDYINVAFWPSGRNFDGELSGYKFWPGTAQLMVPRGGPGGPGGPEKPEGKEPPGEKPGPMGPDSPIGPDSVLSEEEKAKFILAHEKSVGGMLNARDITLANQKKALELGSEIYWGIEAMQLTKTGDRVTGVIGRDREGNYHLYEGTRGVILAAGDFGGNQEMFEELACDVRDLYNPGDGSRKRGGGRDGRGIQMGVWAGGRLEAGVLPTMGGNFNTHRGINGTFGMLWLDPNGKRYCNEVFGDPVIAGMVGNQIPRGTFYNIIDSDIYEYLQWAVPAHEGYDNSMDPEGKQLRSILDRALAAGKDGYESRGPGGDVRIVGGRNMEELLDNARLTGEVRENVRKSILRYNELGELGRDEDFGKDAKLMKPLKWPLFIQFQHYDNRVLCTVGGLLTDGNQNVLGQNFEKIHGLYATGNCCGRRFGPQYSTPTAGISIGIAITLGREAGRDAFLLG